MVFEEKQKLNLWWLYILFGIQAIIILSITFLEDNRISLEQLEEIYYSPLLAIIGIFLVVFFINQNYLLIKISSQGIIYKYWPFTSAKTILWEDVENAYLRKYNALGEYGGWGFRYRLWFRWSDKAFIFDGGSHGLQIVLKNGKKILFGTGKPNELTQFLSNIKAKHPLLMINTNGR